MCVTKWIMFINNHKQLMPTRDTCDVVLLFPECRKMSLEDVLEIISELDPCDESLLERLMRANGYTDDDLVEYMEERCLCR